MLHFMKQNVLIRTKDKFLAPAYAGVMCLVLCPWFAAHVRREEDSVAGSELDVGGVRGAACSRLRPIT